MDGLGSLVVVLVATVSTAALFMVFAGIQRIPWRDGLMIGLGMAIVLVTGGLASSGAIAARDVGSLVFIGAIGGGIAVRGYERGRARRDAAIAAIVDTR